MNYFLELKVYDRNRTYWVRPEHVSAIEHRDDDPYDYVHMLSGEMYIVERGQVSTNKLINHTQHAGLKVLK